MTARPAVALALAAVAVLGACDDGGDDAACDREVVTTESGLRYRDLECGSGEEAVRGTTVRVHYTGSFPDGREFESSYDGREPFEFRLGAGHVIQGWDEGIQGMRVGGERRLTIPPELGYGDAGFPPLIPPGATLIYDVELLDVQAT